MDYKLSLYELGKLLVQIDKKYNMTLLNKIKLSGGWMTINGKVNVEYVPNSEGIAAGNNIISLIIRDTNDSKSSIKITGLKGLNFNINLSAYKYKLIKKSGLNLDQIKEKDDKCTLKIDDNMIFTIDASVEKIKKYI